jgi:flagellar M-ring protein FliF
MEEASQIKAELDNRSIPYELHDGGTTINVPKEQSEQLLVDFAGEGIPNSGNIDYSFFSDNISWGMTDNEFNMLKLDAMQTELANLIKGIEGIDDATVMLSLPPASVFVSDEDKEASASIMLHTSLGYEFKGNQMATLNHLISKAVPNLPEQNIVIMNQYFEYFNQHAQS